LKARPPRAGFRRRVVCGPRPGQRCLEPTVPAAKERRASSAPR
jgi:hypothetical protein